MSNTEVSTELKPHEVEGYLALLDGSDVAEAMRENDELLDAAGLTRVKTPSGGETQWTIEELSGDVKCDAIEGILCYHHKGGVIWPNDDPTPETMPILFTDDLVKGYLVPLDEGQDEDDREWGDIDPDVIREHMNEDGSFNWQDLPQTQFGSGRRGHGKQADEFREICVLRANDIYPLRIRIKGGSLKEWTKQIAKLQVPYFRAKVKLTLEEAESQAGIKYSRVVLAITGYLTPEQGAQVKKIYTESLKKQLLRAPK